MSDLMVASSNAPAGVPTRIVVVVVRVVVCAGASCARATPPEHTRIAESAAVSTCFCMANTSVGHPRQAWISTTQRCVNTRSADQEAFTLGLLLIFGIHS